MKKLLLGLGSLAATTIPVVSVVSCGDDAAASVSLFEDKTITTLSATTQATQYTFAANTIGYSGAYDIFTKEEIKDGEVFTWRSYDNAGEKFSTFTATFKVDAEDAVTADVTDDGKIHENSEGSTHSNVTVTKTAGVQAGYILTDMSGTYKLDAGTNGVGANSLFATATTASDPLLAFINFNWAPFDLSSDASTALAAEQTAALNALLGTVDKKVDETTHPVTDADGDLTALTVADVT